MSLAVSSIAPLGASDLKALINTAVDSLGLSATHRQVAEEVLTYVADTDLEEFFIIAVQLLISPTQTERRNKALQEDMRNRLPKAGGTKESAAQTFIDIDGSGPVAVSAFSRKRAATSAASEDAQNRPIRVDKQKKPMKELTLDDVLWLDAYWSNQIANATKQRDLWEATAKKMVELGAKTLDQMWGDYIKLRNQYLGD